MQVSCKELRKRAWEKLSHGNYWTSVLVTLAVSIANGVAGVFTSAGIRLVKIFPLYAKKPRRQL